MSECINLKSDNSKLKSNFNTTVKKCSLTFIVMSQNFVVVSDALETSSKMEERVLISTCVSK